MYAGGEVVAGGQGVGVIGAQHPLLSARSRSTRCSPRAVGPPPIGPGEVVAGGQGVGVIGAQHPLTVGEDGGAHADRAGQVCGNCQLVNRPVSLRY